MPVPRTSAEYRKHLEDKISWFEKLTDNISGTDDRLDVNNLLLIEILKALQTELGIIDPDPDDPDYSFRGWPANRNSGIIGSVSIDALNTAYQLPKFNVPSGFTAILKAWPTNATIIYVSFSAPGAIDQRQSWPLIPGDIVGWQVVNTDCLYVSGFAVGDLVAVTVEQ